MNAEYPGLEDQPLYLDPPANTMPNPAYRYTTGPASTVGVTQSDTTFTDGVTFTRTWIVTFADPNQDGNSTMKSDVVKIKVNVAWTQHGKSYAVTMTSFTTGKPTT